MIWCRFEVEGRVRYGIVEGSRLTEVEGSPFDEHTVTSVIHSLDEVRLLAPIIPPLLYAAGPNYRGHVEGMAKRRAEEPVYPTQPLPNYRSVTAIIGSEENILVPKDSSGAVQPEGKLAVLIGKKAQKVSVVQAMDHVFGYTIGNDISQRPWQQADQTMFRGKNCDTFNPMGHWIVTGLDPANLRITVRHNAEVWEDFSSADQMWDVATWVHELSEYAALYPGDVLWMGTEGADGTCSPETP